MATNRCMSWSKRVMRVTITTRLRCIKSHRLNVARIRIALQTRLNFFRKCYHFLVRCLWSSSFLRTYHKLTSIWSFQMEARWQILSSASLTSWVWFRCTASALNVCRMLRITHSRPQTRNTTILVRSTQSIGSSTASNTKSNFHLTSMSSWTYLTQMYFHTTVPHQVGSRSNRACLDREQGSPCESWLRSSRSLSNTQVRRTRIKYTGRGLSSKDTSLVEVLTQSMRSGKDSVITIQ